MSYEIGHDCDSALASDNCRNIAIALTIQGASEPLHTRQPTPQSGKILNTMTPRAHRAGLIASLVIPILELRPFFFHYFLDFTLRYYIP
jgi:hypothetical protein